MWREFIVSWNGAGLFLSSTWTNSDALPFIPMHRGVCAVGEFLAKNGFRANWWQITGVDNKAVRMEEVGAWVGVREHIYILVK